MSVNFEGVQAAIAKNATILDVRNHDEVEKDGKIPGSHNVPLPELEAHKPFNHLPKCRSSRLIIYSITSPVPELKAHNLFNDLPKQHLTYQGSFSDWVAHGGDVDKHDH
ncbi:uncharacterized protein LOC108673769 [Hyalella azteca]|uniref:Uncharacterized protein LOC108673769 n=1 Tax=Hyalella azteca TaxID=294128 RepID=A0A8B7NTN7_HYAAZ|nr:uncharacterized protein LOC108673769 [Hyalella azteca]